MSDLNKEIVIQALQILPYYKNAHSIVNRILSLHVGAGYNEIVNSFIDSKLLFLYITFIFYHM